MSWNFAKPQQVHDIRISSISKTEINAQTVQERVAVIARKEPIVVLFDIGEGWLGVDVNGMTLDLTGLEVRFPGLSEMLNQAQ